MKFSHGTLFINFIIQEYFSLIIATIAVIVMVCIIATIMFMKTINAKEAQNNFGDLMNEIIKEPMIINKYGKPRAVLMSFEEYENLLNLKIYIG